MNFKRALSMLIAAALSGPATAIHAQMPEMPPIKSPPLKHPTRYNPATLSGARAESVYQAIREQIRENYARSDDPLTQAYQTWPRFNKAPYRSRNHGGLFVNTYANEKAADYGKFENLGPLPPGALIVKDSFMVTRNGVVMTGPLFVMEKMDPGFRSAAGTWRFMALRPDGSLMGMTAGPGSKNVQFCADCHKKVGAVHEYLFFMPKNVRLKN